jgi:hypothetical protein
LVVVDDLVVLLLVFFDARGVRGDRDEELRGRREDQRRKRRLWRICSIRARARA